MVKFNYTNTMRSIHDDTYLGMSGCMGYEADSIEDVVKHALELATKTRKIWGFPVRIITIVEHNDW